jgi:hypothetical protein
MKISRITPILFIVCLSLEGCKGQKAFGIGQLILKHTIALPNVKGRIDHLDFDPGQGVIYTAALGNNSLEVASIKEGKHLFSVKGLNEPQGVVFIPETNEVMVASGGDGIVNFTTINLRMSPPLILLPMQMMYDTILLIKKFMSAMAMAASPLSMH